jgi:hypothetical protein
MRNAFVRLISTFSFAAIVVAGVAGCPKKDETKPASDAAKDAVDAAKDAGAKAGDAVKDAGAKAGETIKDAAK